MKRELLQPAYVLHRRAYRESSFLVELFTLDHGRLSVLARGVRKVRSPTQGLIQPFIPLFVSWSGRGELMTLTHIEMDIKNSSNTKQLNGKCLFAGLYLNELLMSLLQKWDAHPGLYAAYAKALMALQTTSLEEKTLRSFEKTLLEELGYGLLPKGELSRHNTFLPDQTYRFVPDQGFQLSVGDEAANSMLFSGKSLLAIANEDWQDKQCLQDAKRLTRFILAPLLGRRPLYSRRLFVQPED